MRAVNGVPDGYVLEAAGFVERAKDFYFQGDQAIIVNVACLSVPFAVTVKILRIQRTQLQNWWTQFWGPPTYHWDDVVVDSFESWIAPLCEIYVETDQFGSGPFSYHFRIETGATIAAGRGNPAPVSVQIWSNE